MLNKTSIYTWILTRWTTGVTVYTRCNIAETSPTWRSHMSKWLTAACLVTSVSTSPSMKYTSQMEKMYIFIQRLLKQVKISELPRWRMYTAESTWSLTNHPCTKQCEDHRDLSIPILSAKASQRCWFNTITDDSANIKDRWCHQTTCKVRSVNHISSLQCIQRPVWNT